ncbi:hypothetical protein GCM10009789_58680 [Kribbella sancticallisti]|uniref:PH domain-containing protein n=1 Tax=Kribbella sancticallisti TaxID=460087 RepID=A0ABP4Q6I7_9ACTN
MLAAVGFKVVDLVRDDQISWWEWGSAPGALLALWGVLVPAVERLTVTSDGIVVSGPVLRRKYSWRTIEAIELGRKPNVTVDLGRRGRHTFSYDGKNGRPSQVEVAGVLQRGWFLNTSGLTTYRVSLSWGAAVFLPAVAAVVAATAWALFKG